MSRKVYVWDPGIRLFHWLLAASIISSFLSIEVFDAPLWHAYSGWLACSLLIFRTLWACVVWPVYANPLIMWRSLQQLFSYLPHLLARPGKIYLGHNPLGMLAVAVMVICIVILVLTGLMQAEEGIVGALNEHITTDVANLASEVHEITGKFLEIMVLVHIAAVVFYTFYKKQALLAAMLHGSKTTDANLQADYQGNQHIDSSFIIRAVLVATATLAVSMLLFQLWVTEGF